MSCNCHFSDMSICRFLLRIMFSFVVTTYLSMFEVLPSFHYCSMYLSVCLCPTFRTCLSVCFRSVVYDHDVPSACPCAFPAPTININVNKYVLFCYLHGLLLLTFRHCSVRRLFRFATL
jgi:hypothetical protein